MILDFNNIDVFDELFCIRTPTGTHEYIISGDSHEKINCGGGYEFLACHPIGEYDRMRAIFKCSKCNVIFEDIYNYSEFESYKESGLEGEYKEPRT